MAGATRVAMDPAADARLRSRACVWLDSGTNAVSLTERIAPCGQAVAQASHWLHIPWMMDALPSWSAMPPEGQTSAQMPHPEHRLSST